MHTIRTLMPWELWKYRDHLLRLDAEDRRLRFGSALGDEAVRRFAERMDPARNLILVYCENGGEVVGAVHVAISGTESVELGFSVERRYRGARIGTALCERALLASRNRGFRRAVVYCLPENMAMRRLALRCGLSMRFGDTECEGSLALLPPTPLTIVKEFSTEALGTCFVAVIMYRRALGGFQGSPYAVG